MSENLCRLIKEGDVHFYLKYSVSQYFNLRLKIIHFLVEKKNDS